MKKPASRDEREAALRELCRRYRIVAMYAFGSRGREVAAWLRGEGELARISASDIDIGVLPERDQSSQNFGAQARVGLMQALEDLFGAARVDLVILPEADPFLAANVVRGERLYADDHDLADEYDLYILRRAGDLAPLERQRIALILEEGR